MIYVILPAYNEEKDLPATLRQFAGLPVQVTLLLVDDGSTDATADIAAGFGKEHPLILISHPNNRGLGAALSSGFLKAAESVHDEDIVVTMDADNTHPSSLIPRMQEAIQTGADVVIASRFAKGGIQRGVPLFRRFLSSSAGLLLRALCPVPGVRDYTSGYRAFSGPFIKKLYTRYGENLVTEKGFPATVEILMKAGRLSARISEVPLELRYDNKSGKSKIRIFATIRRYLLLIMKMKR